MGRQIPLGPEVAVKVVSGEFTGPDRSGNANAGINAGQNPQLTIFKDVFNAALWGEFDGTVVLEKSFDGGLTCLPVSKDASGSPASYGAPCAIGVYEPEHNVLYSWNCTDLKSGSVNYRISQ